MIAALNQRAGILTVEQLNHAQWHVVDADTRWASAVTNWVAAVDAALWAAILTRSGVESVSLSGDRLLLLHPPART